MSVPGPTENELEFELEREDEYEQEVLVCEAGRSGDVELVEWSWWSGVGGVEWMQ
jgi:hypothetical protein